MMIATFKRNCSVVLAIVASVLLLAGGCDNEQEASGLDRSQRLVRSSSETFTMTPQEIENAADGGGAARQSNLATSIADRLIQADSVDNLNQELDRLQEMIQGDDAQRQAALNELMAYNAANSTKITGFLTEAADRRDERLKDAVEATQLVLDDDRENPAAAWMLGTIKLLQGRLLAQSLNNKTAAVLNQFIELNRLAERIQTENIVRHGLALYAPDDSIKQLQQVLNGPDGEGVPSLRTQLASTQDALTELGKQREQTQRSHDENQQAMQNLHQQYMNLLAQAEKVSGQDRFQLEQQAYALRGAGENPAKPTLHEYEATMENAADELRKLDANIALQELRLRQLTDNIAQTERRIDELKTAPIHEQVRQGLEGSSSRLAMLNEMFTQALTVAQKLENDYREQRMDVINLYNESINAFSQAQRNLERQRRELAGEMIQRVHGDLMRLWNKDMECYENAATIVSALETVGVMSDAVSSLQATFADQAILARTSAEKEAAQAQEASEETTTPEPFAPADTSEETPETENSDPADEADAEPMQ